MGVTKTSQHLSEIVLHTENAAHVQLTQRAISSTFVASERREYHLASAKIAKQIKAKKLIS